jgi:hypothetical protein
MRVTGHQPFTFSARKYLPNFTEINLPLPASNNS